MKKVKTFITAALSLAIISTQAQTETPKGFSKGSIILADGSVIAGLIKDDMGAKAAVTVIPEAGGKKKTYDAYNLGGAEVGGARFRCVKGDFFRVISAGDLDFLQKASNCAGKMVYNGTEAIYLAGTDGKPGDYFVYNAKTASLQLVTGKNVASVTEDSFANCAAAISKAKEAGTDIAKLKDAVDIYNNRNEK